MNKQSWVALVLAVVAALMTYYYLSEKEAALKAETTPIKVLTAAKPIARGSVLTADKVAVQEIPGAYVMPGAISAATQKDVARQWQGFKGQFALVPISQGEQILPNKLSGIPPGFSGAVPEGMRIVAFSLDLPAAVGGHLKPGNRVDVFGTFEHQYKGTKQLTSVILAQNVLITAVGEDTAADRNPGKNSGAVTASGGINICLALSPDDALRLSLSEKEGSLKLALRSLNDQDLLDLPDQNLGTVLAPLLRARKDEARPAPKRIEIIKGMQ